MYRPNRATAVVVHKPISGAKACCKSSQYNMIMCSDLHGNDHYVCCASVLPAAVSSSVSPDHHHHFVPQQRGLQEGRAAHTGRRKQQQKGGQALCCNAAIQPATVTQISSWHNGGLLTLCCPSLGKRARGAPSGWCSRGKADRKLQACMQQCSAGDACRVTGNVCCLCALLLCRVAPSLPL